MIAFAIAAALLASPPQVRRFCVAVPRETFTGPKVQGHGSAPVGPKHKAAAFGGWSVERQSEHLLLGGDCLNRKRRT